MPAWWKEAWGSLGLVFRGALSATPHALWQVAIAGGLEEMPAAMEWLSLTFLLGPTRECSTCTALTAALISGSSVPRSLGLGGHFILEGWGQSLEHTGTSLGTLKGLS